MTPEEQTAIVDRWNQAVQNFVKAMEQMAKIITDVFYAVHEFLKSCTVKPGWADYPSTPSLRLRDNRKSRR